MACLREAGASLRRRQAARLLIAIRLSGYGAAYFFASGAFMSYWPVWLRERGVQDAEIGTLYMSRQLVSVASTLLIGVVAHRLGNVRGVILALAAAAALLMTGYQFAYTFTAILAVGLVWGSVWSPSMALYDGVLVNETRARGFNYGNLRVWSSVAFILGTVLCGFAVDRNGPAWVLYVALSGIVLLVPFGLLLPKAEPQHKHDGRHAPFGVLDLLTSRPFLLFMVATGFCQASHAVLYSFGTLTWRAAGLSDLTISFLWGGSVAVEILLMLVSGRLIQRLGVCGMIAFALGCAMVRWLGMAFTTALPALVILQALHAGSFAACHLGAMAFIQRALPPSGVSLGQSVYYAIGTGAAQAVIFQLAGLLYAAHGQRAFLGMFVVAAIGMAAIATLARRWKGDMVVGQPA
ncbi:MAG: MFS transporter [Alphaproteobacteria bacterium]|nr:MFS transporter [Alphaproteobacteria bacterium]